MGYMKFVSPTLEIIFREFEWARNNTIEIFDQADKNNILYFSSSQNNKFIFQPIVFQFQCIVTTTDAYYRKLTKNKNKQFGVFVQGENIVSKKDIKKEEIKNLLKKQIFSLENLLITFDQEKTEKNIDLITAITNHEYLHQGQLTLMLRESGVDLPERFRKAWAL